MQYRIEQQIILSIKKIKMENDDILTEEFGLDEARKSLTGAYGLTENDVSKMHLILYQKLVDIDNRIKKLEEHLLVSVIHKDM
jgi:hypothetical protein